MKLTLPSILFALGLLTNATAAAPPTTTAAEPIKAVYHVNEPDKVWTALRNIQNHLRDDPSARIVLVANGGGIDFLLKDATDKQGTPFQPTLSELAGKGVTFKVCRKHAGRAQAYGRRSSGKGRRHSGRRRRDRAPATARGVRLSQTLIAADTTPRALARIGCLAILPSDGLSRCLFLRCYSDKRPLIAHALAMSGIDPSDSMGRRS